MKDKRRRVHRSWLLRLHSTNRRFRSESRRVLPARLAKYYIGASNSQQRSPTSLRRPSHLRRRSKSKNLSASSERRSPRLYRFSNTYRSSKSNYRSLTSERRSAKSERRSLTSERRSAKSERRSAKSERRSLTSERRSAKSERRSAKSERRLAKSTRRVLTGEESEPLPWLRKYRSKEEPTNERPSSDGHRWSRDRRQSASDYHRKMRSRTGKVENEKIGVGAPRNDRKRINAREGDIKPGHKEPRYNKLPLKPRY